MSTSQNSYGSIKSIRMSKDIALRFSDVHPHELSTCSCQCNYIGCQTIKFLLSSLIDDILKLFFSQSHVRFSASPGAAESCWSHQSSTQCFLHWLRRHGKECSPKVSNRLKRSREYDVCDGSDWCCSRTHWWNVILSNTGKSCWDTC